MAATVEEKTAFAGAVRRLRDLRGLSRPALAALLAMHKDLNGEPLTRTPQAISYWEDASFAPDRHTARMLEMVLDAPGELLPLLGYDDEETILRLDAMERRLVSLEETLRKIMKLVERQS